MRSCLLLLGLLCNTLLSANSDSLPHSFKLGVGFAGNSTGAGIDIDLATPRIFYFGGSGGRSRSDVHGYLELGDEWVSNLVQRNGSFLTVHNALLGVGLRSQTSFSEGGSFVSPYSGLGLELLILSPELASQRVSPALRVGIGCDLIVANKLETLFGLASSAVFVEGNLIFFHRKSNTLTGEPVIRDGFVARIGFRSHF